MPWGNQGTLRTSWINFRLARKKDNKLASREATLVRNYHPLFHAFTGFTVTSVDKRPFAIKRSLKYPASILLSRTLANITPQNRKQMPLIPTSEVWPGTPGCPCLPRRCPFCQLVQKENNRGGKRRLLFLRPFVSHWLRFIETAPSPWRQVLQRLWGESWCWWAGNLTPLSLFCLHSSSSWSWTRFQTGCLVYTWHLIPTIEFAPMHNVPVVN